MSIDMKKPAGVKVERSGKAITSAIAVLLACLVFPLNAADDISGKAYLSANRG